MAESKKKLETTQVSQFCLDTLTVFEFLKSLPKSMNVYGMRYRCTHKGIRKRLQIPEYIKGLGVVSATLTGEALDINGKFLNTPTIQHMTQAIERIAKTYHLSPERFHVASVTIMDKAKTSSLSFERMYKQIRFPNDKRRKKLVLGMVSGDGADYHDMLAKISAKKIVCTLAKTEKTIVMCSEEVAKK